jgi:hypothetical protein
VLFYFSWTRGEATAGKIKQQQSEPPPVKEVVVAWPLSVLYDTALFESRVILRDIIILENSKHGVFLHIRDWAK